MTTNSFSERELRWFITPRLPQGERPKPWLQRWLLDKSSLTTKLVQLSQGQFRVEVVRQVNKRASRSEAKALGIPVYSLTRVREVVLFGRNQPWVFARSILPFSSLTGRLRHLHKQGNQPLGAFLFSQPHLRRGAIALANINRHHGYVPQPLMGNNPAWGRRSVFYVDGKPLLVSEVFLESFLSATQNGQSHL